MDAVSRIDVNRAYFEATYDDWLKYHAKWRPYELLFFIVLLCTGLAFTFFSSTRLMGIIGTCGGLYHGYEALVYRKRWIRERLAGLPQEKHIQIRFRDTTMETETPNSLGTVAYAALSKVVPTPNGIFLLPQTGISIYVPKWSVEPADAFNPLCEHLDRLVNKREREGLTRDVTNA